MSTNRIHYLVVRSGKLITRVQNLLDEYRRKYNVDIVRTLQNEKERLQDEQFLLLLFDEDPSKQMKNRAKIRALNQILEVINSWGHC